jgi:hypothetical protein
MVLLPFSTLMVDVESGSFMDETNQLFNLCKKKYKNEIETKSKLNKVDVHSALESKVTVGCDE